MRILFTQKQLEEQRQFAKDLKAGKNVEIVFSGTLEDGHKWLKGLVHI